MSVPLYVRLRQGAVARVTAAAFGLVVTVTWPQIGEALAPEEEATDWWDQGMTAWEEGNPDRALACLRRSYELMPEASTACQIGRIARERGWNSTARAWFERCQLDSGQNEEEGTAAAELARLSGSPIGALVVKNDQSGLQLMVDGRPVEPAPRGSRGEHALAPGRHQVVLVDEAGRAVTVPATVFVEASEATRVSLQLVDQLSERRSAAALVPRLFWSSFAAAWGLSAGTGIALGLDAYFRAQGDQSASQAALISALVIGGTAGLAWALSLSLWPLKQHRQAELGPSGVPGAWAWQVSHDRRD